MERTEPVFEQRTPNPVCFPTAYSPRRRLLHGDAGSGHGAYPYEGHNAVIERPTWRRIASRLLLASYRIVTPIDRVVRRNRSNAALLPPAHLRIYYYRTWRVSAFTEACERARTEACVHGLRSEHRVLDIGSGIGNLAIGLFDYLQGSYDGVDIHTEAVEWCQRAITPLRPQFRFHRADLASRAYNPDGQLPASVYTFPFPDRTFDFIFLASVFTHMLPDAVEHYVREISRLLAPNGICVASYFLVNEETRPSIEAGRSFIDFSEVHPSGVYRLHDATVPEAAVALEEDFVRRIHADAGLSIRNVRRGRWWSGEAHDQDVIAVVRLPD
jgi:SAM-dependent methyltransferase